jgi:DNA-binding NarL/FixJ family response regulator
MLGPLLANLIALDEGFQVAGVTTDGEEALRCVEELSPDILLLDLGLPGRSGLEVLRALKDRGSAARVLVLTGYADAQNAVKAFQLGARGFLAKGEPVPVLMEALRATMAGEHWVSAKLARQIVAFLPLLSAEKSATARADEPLLTEREHAVATLVAEGKTNREIAGQLGLREATIKVHIGRALDKLNLSNRTQLALAMRPPCRRQTTASSEVNVKGPVKGCRPGSV